MMFVLEGAAQTVNVLPDFFVGFPASLTWTSGGSKQNGALTAAARIALGLSEIAGTMAGLRLTQAGFERREEEWRHQVEVLDLELQQIERQILAAERRRDIALRELNNHQRQLEHSAEVHDFLRDKFTNHALHQRGHTARTFVTAEIWDHLREGLQAGERLQLALRQMEHAYLDANVREYELTKHISLRVHFPAAFLQLQATGACEIDLPEWMFDADYPGHYMLRIKNMTLTIPAVVGPYTGVHCRLTLLQSTTRVHPHLVDPPHACCPDGRPGNGYPALPDDRRIVSQYAATEAIATSSGQNDSGMFELSFRDERYLPFEFAGAVSRWRIELPPGNNQFDLDTVAAVVLHLNYTAREGGEMLREAADEIARQHLPGAGVRLFDVQHDMPDAWHRFQGPLADGDAARRLAIRLHRGMFPFVSGRPELAVTQITLLLEVAGARPSAHAYVEFQQSPAHGDDAGNCCDARHIHCVAGDWPGLYQGVLNEIDLPPLGRHDRELGTLSIPADIGAVTGVFLLLRYEAVPAATSARPS